MSDISEYTKKLSEVLNARAEWLEQEELPKLKDEFRTFHTAFYSIYSLLLKRMLIREDPYKQEAKIVDIAVPDTSVFSESDRLEQMGLRLSNFDNQLDFLVNFYQCSLDTLGLDRIKRILGLVRYIDWAHFVELPDTSCNTRGMIELINQARTGADPLTLNVLADAVSSLGKSTGSILNHLKKITEYHREAFKLDVRENITASMSEAEASQIPQIKKKYAGLYPGKPFYAELLAEILKEDYSKDGPALQARVLKQFDTPAAKAKTVQAPASFKPLLIEGLFAIGSVSFSYTELIPKLDENAGVLENKRKTFLAKIRKVMQQMLNRNPESAVYDIEYADPAKGVMIREQVVFNTFRDELDKRARSLFNISTKGTAVAKLEAMEDAQLLSLLEKNIREVQGQHKTLTALDDFFKTAVDRADRNKIKGIKPELAVIKNALVKANQKKYEYNAQKEEEEQFKRLGITGQF